MNYGITPPNLIDTSVEEAKREQQLEDAAARIRFEHPDLVAEKLIDRIPISVWYGIIKTGNTLDLLELIDDTARKLVIDGEDDALLCVLSDSAADLLYRGEI